MAHWTAEQVIALAPDASSIKAGQGLANPAKWQNLGLSTRSLWGECLGSGKQPYRTQIDLQGPAFQCSCPSRKFPCKHGLGLMLIFAANAGAFAEGEAPTWVDEWLAKRDAAAEKKANKDAPVALDAGAASANREAREKRAIQRETRVREGLVELQTWLDDVVRRGFATLPAEPTRKWDDIAARMIDCQAPGLARMLRRVPTLLASGDRWADRTLEHLGLLQLAVRGFGQAESLPLDLRADVRATIGFTTSEEDLAGQPSFADRWQVLGRRIEDEDRLRVQRTWLVGEASGRTALVLSFSAAGQPLDISLVPGTAVDADLVFHPSAAPLRAQVRAQRGQAERFREARAAGSFAAALDATATMAAGNPWLERFPWSVRGCVPYVDGTAWFVRDEEGSAVPLASSFPRSWELLAISGGHPVVLFGEWNGEALLPLSLWVAGDFISLADSLA